MQIFRRVSAVCISAWLACVFQCQVCSGQDQQRAIVVPFAKCAYIEPYQEVNRYGQISENGVGAWTDAEAEIRIYFLAAKRGKLILSLTAKSPDSQSTLRIDCAGKQFDAKILKTNDFREVPIGSISIEETGYQTVTIKGVTKTGAYFPDIRELVIRGPAAQGVLFNSSRYRTAPSTHLSYATPGGVEIDAFYSELMIPEGADPSNSFFMANGFSGGYFGIQVNSPTERRVLFSVWSPFKTDDPKKIPADHRVLLIEKGKNVTTNDFGNEGAGGQSFLRFNWTSGVTYKFMLQATRNDRERSNTYTARFFAPEEGQWRLIATWKQQKSDTRLLTGLYSFVENFGPSTGNRLFKGYYGNQWARTTRGRWGELKKASFSTTADPQKHPRFDIGAGVKGDAFYMYSGGFKIEKPPTQPNSSFTRQSGKRPSLR